MSLSGLPVWLWAVLGAESLALGLVTWRFGARGLGWGLAAALAFWFVLALGGSFLVSRLEGGAPGPLLPGAFEAVGRIAALAAAPSATAALVGFLARGLRRRHRSASH